jgi:ferredoxin-nitrate reductase
MQPRRMSCHSTEGVPDDVQWSPSTCGLCSIGCGLEIGSRRGEIVGVRGRVDHPVGRGRLGPKGLQQWQANAHPDRGLYPMVRSRTGALQRTTWLRAMQTVVARFERALAVGGPNAVGFYNSGQLLLEDYYTLAKIARGGIATPNLDANTRLCTATTGESLMLNFGADGPPGCFADFDVTEAIVLFGHNAAEQSTVLWMRILAARDRPNPPRLIVIDPRRTQTAEAADLHLRPKPGTNLALANGLCREIIEHGWLDRAFVDDHTMGFDEFAQTVAAYSPERVQSITGVDAADVRKAAEWIGTSKSTMTTCLQGVYQSHQATATAATVNAMHLLMGKIGKPGSAPFQFAGQPSSMNTRECGADGSYPAYRNWDSRAHMKDLAKRWNVPVEHLGKKPVTAPEIFELCREGHIEVLWVIGTNPLVSMTNLPWVREALERVFLIVQDPFATTETVGLADVYLPAAMWGEKTGCMTNAERRCNLVEKVVEPPGQARADMEIFVDFATRLGLSNKDGGPLIGYSSPEKAFDEWRAVSAGMIPDYSKMSYASIAARGGVQWPCTRSHPGGTERLYTDFAFHTATAETEDFSKDPRTGHARTLPEYATGRASDRRARFVAVEWEAPLERPDEGRPLTAITGRQAWHWHTRTKTARATRLAQGAPSVYVQLARRDAEQLGVAEGDLVRVTSARGSVVAPAHIGDVVPEGVVFLPFHYGEAAANELTMAAWDPVSKQPMQKLAAVRIEVAS